MSGGESCASVAPSTNVTSEWTMLSGCTTMSIRSTGTSKSQRASSTSNPLFIIVAESTVTFGPIFQRGWFNACAGVTDARSAGASRKGPPEAVRIRRSTAPPPCRHWKIAECSLSTGRKRTPFRRAAVVTSSPAMTMTSFVARAMDIPFSIASRVGRRPLSPTVATRQMSASFSSTARTAASAPV